MAKPTKKVADRIKSSIPRFQKILSAAKNRDVNESDTVTIVVDLLAECFGFDKYSEVTSEMAIRGEYCDLATVIDNKVQFLIEVKAIGLDLKENHLRQAINYGANEGIPWIILTNGISWQVHKIKFEKPISHEMVMSFDFMEVTARSSDDVEKLYLVCRESLTKGKAAIEEYHEYSQVINRHTVAAILQTEGVVKAVRRDLKKISPNSKVSIEDVEELIKESLKRDVVEGDQSKSASKLIRKVARREAKAKEKSKAKKPHISTSSEVNSDAVT